VSSSAFMANHKLESFMLIKGNKEVEDFAVRMGMVGVGGESGFSGAFGTGVIGCRPKVEFDVI
jgi:hypothetical protein